MITGTRTTCEIAAYTLQSEHNDARLRVMIDAWPTSPQAVKTKILALTGR